MNATQRKLNSRMTIIAGPCSAESEEQVLETARGIAALGIGTFRAGIWKPRTRPGGFEGVGAAGLPWLTRVKSELGLTISTEVATRDHVRECLKAEVDMLWIGARTTVNPFAVQEIADALQGNENVTVLVKNPVSPDLELWIGAIQRLQRAGVRHIGAIHRGFRSCDTENTTQTKYRNTPLWNLPLELRSRMPEIPIFCDPSHISGKRDLISSVSRRAMELQFNGLMIETHISPETALSDAAQQLTPGELSTMLDYLEECSAERNCDSVMEHLSEMRSRIDLIDEQLAELISQRWNLSSQMRAVYGIAPSI